MRSIPLLVLALLTGCARYPSGDGAGLNKRITFTATFETVPNRNLVYVFPINPSPDVNPTTTGPIPVVAPPWGNGFVAGTAKYFVRYDPDQRRPYVLYRFVDADQNAFVDAGIPLSWREPSASSPELSFTLDLTQLGGADLAKTYQSLQVNILTMDRVPQGSDSRPKVWDGLGDSRNAAELNSFVNIPLDSTRTFDNRFYNDLEVSGDVSTPELDLADFSIRVQVP